MLFRSDRKSTRLNSSHLVISYAVFCLKKKNTTAALYLARLIRAFRAAAPRASCPRDSPEHFKHVRWLRSPRVFFFFFFLMIRDPPKFHLFPSPDALPI